MQAHREAVRRRDVTGHWRGHRRQQVQHRTVGDQVPASDKGEIVAYLLSVGMMQPALDERSATKISSLAPSLETVGWLTGCGCRSPLPW